MLSLPAIAALAAILTKVAVAAPLMDTLLEIPELSTYAHVYNMTGGIVEINPMFTKRFNYDTDTRNYTFLAPTNAAWAKIPSAIYDILLTQPAYPLIEALLRTHIIEARLTAAELASVSADSAVGGIATALQLSNTTAQFHRGVLTKTVQGYYIDATTSANGTVRLDDQAAIVKADLPADNGLIHEIDQLVDPFLVYGGGPSNRTTAPSYESTDLTIGAFVQSDARLVNASQILSVNSPDTIRRLSRQSSEKQFFVVPRNEAFELMPTILPVFHTLVSPYKSPFDTLLWQYGWVDSGGEQFDSRTLVGKSSLSVASDVTGLNITVTREEEDAAVFVMNAGLVTQVEAANGFLWIVDRWLDPLYQAFGPVDRFGEPEWA
ncbi:fasciclin domain-containing protein [Aspergillus fijiensis CBS 313.89]|uniref:FAS1 domain-containing protein n=1 Tax=Aspergillus fijiensis CBS 313.89 TaxID=1448319 RepID=A0A8G1W0S6_9EURO|nr:FAS1 domain-containing protein [Aspergillus fijiensis CBS 313.89]RAK80205.1 FAS1 domain-containing protein [Aspergillus fijiensis CBS 313.89]